MLPRYALCTLADVKRRFPVQGAETDAALEDAIAAASREIEGVVGRRLVFRAPTVDDDALIASTSVPTTAGTTTPASAGAPSASGSILVLTVTDANRRLLAGGITATLTITGTVAGVAGTTETFDLCAGVSPVYGTKFFTAISARSLVVTGSPVSGPTFKLGTSAGYLDYFSPSANRSSLWLPDWPVQQIASLYEDSNRGYAADTLLVEDTDFCVEGDSVGRSRGVLVRTSSATGGEDGWETGYRAEKLTWSGGYRTVAGVPDDVRAACVRTAMSYYSAERRNNFGVSTQSDPMGNFTRFGAPGLSDGDRQLLQRYVNRDMEREFVRAFDLEAA